MKSNICELSQNTAALSAILEEAEKTAVYVALDKKQSGRLRLLAEELVGMLPELLHFSTGEFWIEANGKSFELHTALSPNDMMTYELREKLLALSSSGKNAAATGIMAKIRLAAEFMMIDYSQTAMANEGFYLSGIDHNQTFYAAAWSLNLYREQTKAEQGEPWDELERSIVANIADDVLVGVDGKKVEIIVKKAF
jgi:hypothetical protein